METLPGEEEVGNSSIDSGKHEILFPPPNIDGAEQRQYGEGVSKLSITTIIGHHLEIQNYCKVSDAQTKLRSSLDQNARTKGYLHHLWQNLQKQQRSSTALG